MPEYLQNVNNYLLNIENKECIEVDLDGNKQKEYIVRFIKDGNTYLSLFDSPSNLIVNLLNEKGEKGLKNILEIADVDNDGVMELIIIKENSLEIHKYNNGFYY